MQEVDRLYQSVSQGNGNRGQTSPRDQSSGNRRQTSSRGQSNGNRRQIIVPEQSKRFEMYGKSHTLYMYLRNGLCGVDIASRRQYFLNVIGQAIIRLGGRENPHPDVRKLIEFETEITNYQYDINMQSKEGDRQAMINAMHRYLDRIALRLSQMGNKHKIQNLQELGNKKRYADGDELRPEYQGGRNIREIFYGRFNSTSENNRKKLLAAAKAEARNKPGYNNIPAADRRHIYWCEDRGIPPKWTAHLADDRIDNEKPELDHIREVSNHWNNEGNNQTQAQREAWFNDTSNHQIVCKHHNASKGGEDYKNYVGPKFKGPGE